MVERSLRGYPRGGEGELFGSPPFQAFGRFFQLLKLQTLLTTATQSAGNRRHGYAALRATCYAKVLIRQSDIKEKLETFY